MLCPICFDDAINIDIPIVETPCKHNFHTSCLSTWMRQNRAHPTCPCCRTLLINDTPPLSIGKRLVAEVSQGNNAIVVLSSIIERHNITMEIWSEDDMDGFYVQYIDTNIEMDLMRVISLERPHYIDTGSQGWKLVNALNTTNGFLNVMPNISGRGNKFTVIVEIHPNMFVKKYEYFDNWGHIARIV